MASKYDSGFNNDKNREVNCSFVDSNDNSFDSNESVPIHLRDDSSIMSSNESANDQEISMEAQYENVYNTAPDDVVIPESDLINESEIESVEGNYPDREIDNAYDIIENADFEQNLKAQPMTQAIQLKPWMTRTIPTSMWGPSSSKGSIGTIPIGSSRTIPQTSTTQTSMVQKGTWSPTKTIETVVNKGGPNVNNNVYQVIVDEMIKDKCWKEEDYVGFVKSMGHIREIIDATSDDKRLEMVLNPKYFNAIHDAIDKLDTINVVCLFGTGNKCAMINNPAQRKTMKKQVMLLGRLVDIYVPIFVRIILLIEKFTKDLSTPESCNLDPVYLSSIQMLKKRIVGSLYMRKLNKQKGNFTEQNELLRHMSNESDQESKNDTEYEKETFCSKSKMYEYETDYITILFFFVVAAILIYVLVQSK